jgi:hypothetical protein
LLSDFAGLVRQGPPWSRSSFEALEDAWEKADPSDPDERSNWAGGSYDLAIELASTDDASVEQTLAAIWRTADIKDRVSGDADNQPVSTPPTIKSLAGYLRGVVRLPGGRQIVCGASRMTEEDGPDWLLFSLPLGALERVDRRVGSFPLGDDGGPLSLTWRQPLDRWLVDIARAVYDRVPFKLALVGWEPAFEAHADELAGEAPADRDHAYLLPTPSGLRYYEATK